MNTAGGQSANAVHGSSPGAGHDHVDQLPPGPPALDLVAYILLEGFEHRREMVSRPPGAPCGDIGAATRYGTYAFPSPAARMSGKHDAA